jgi:hypothetical protein
MHEHHAMTDWTWVDRLESWAFALGVLALFALSAAFGVSCLKHAFLAVCRWMVC